MLRRNRLLGGLCGLLVAFSAKPDGTQYFNLAADEWFHRPTSTYEKFLPLALEGDPDIQNLLGFMFFYGEGVVRNFDEAHAWFHEAAEQGDINARKNLGFFHSGANANVPLAYVDLKESAMWFRLALKAGHERQMHYRHVSNVAGDYAGRRHLIKGEVDVGEKLYLTFCAGCHGFNGIAYYVNSPSFALGERLYKSDDELRDSITNGKGAMPNWGGKLTDEDIAKLVRFVRSLRRAFAVGIGHEMRSAPSYHFRFRPTGETGSEWRSADPIGQPPFN